MYDCFYTMGAMCLKVVGSLIVSFVLFMLLEILCWTFTPRCGINTTTDVNHTIAFFESEYGVTFAGTYLHALKTSEQFAKVCALILQAIVAGIFYGFVRDYNKSPHILASELNVESSITKYR